MGRKAQRRYRKVCGVRLSWLEWGEKRDDRPSLLVLHGLIATAETFQRFADELPEFHIIALDLPGNGESERSNDTGMSITGLAELVKTFAGDLDLDKPVLVGHSHGGAVALSLAMSAPDLLHSLVLLCPAHPFSGREDALVEFYLSPPGRAFAKLIPKLPRALFLHAFRRMPGKRRHFGQEDIAAYLGSLRTPGTVPQVLRLLQTWKPDMAALRRQLESTELRVPTLLIWGDRDLVVPLRSADSLMKHLATSNLVMLRDVGHLPNEEAPEECAAAIREWLSE